MNTGKTDVWVPITLTHSWMSIWKFLNTHIGPKWVTLATRRMQLYLSWSCAAILFWGTTKYFSTRPSLYIINISFFCTPLCFIEQKYPKCHNCTNTYTSSSELPGAGVCWGFSLFLLGTWGLAVAWTGNFGRGWCVVWWLDSFWFDNTGFCGCTGTRWAKFEEQRTRCTWTPLFSNWLWAESWDTGTRFGPSPKGLATFKKKDYVLLVE